MCMVKFVAEHTCYTVELFLTDITLCGNLFHKEVKQKKIV
jgi:hypothetical protein